MSSVVKYKTEPEEPEYPYDLRLDGDESSSTNEEVVSSKEKKDDSCPNSSRSSSPTKSKPTKNAQPSRTQRSKRRLSRKDSSGFYDLPTTGYSVDGTENAPPPSSTNQEKTEKHSSSNCLSWRDLNFTLLGFLLGLITMAVLRPYVFPSSQGKLLNQKII